MSCFPTALAPEYKRFDKSPEKGLYTVTLQHFETSPVNRTNLPTTTLIYAVPCILIHRN